MPHRSPWMLCPCLVLLASSSSCRLPHEQKRDPAPGDASAGVARGTETGLVYPVTRTVDVVDDYHGTLVEDPYRWLEDLDSAETRAWVEAQNELSFGYLASIPERRRIRRRLEKLWNHERYGLPTGRGGRYFYLRNDGLEDQSVLYVSENLTGEPRVLIDPNRLSKDGTVSLRSRSPSPDGRWYAYGLSDAGSDWVEIRVRDAATGDDLGERLRWVKFGGPSWLPDSSGFYYSRYDAPEKGDEHEAANYHQKVYFHRVGTEQSEDRLVYERPDDKRMRFWTVPSEDGRWLVVHVFTSGRKNAVYYRALEDRAAGFTPLLTGFDASYYFLGNDGTRFWFQTTNGAPGGRIVAIDVASPEPASWKEVVPETKNAIRDVSLVGQRFVISYLEDARSRILIHRLDGSLEKELELPTLGSVSGFSGRRTDNETFYSFRSFTYPPTIYRYDFDTGKSELFRRPDVDFDPARFVAKQVFYRSKDGTRVPMFIAHQRGIELDGNNPTYLTGYGGFNISQTPRFSLSALVWMEMGGVYALPNLRGGGEYGVDWHEAGTKARKQNVFDDFIAAAEWLIGQGYTSRKKLAIAGGSNGGLLVGACMTQRPELYAAALPAVGVMDMLRFHEFTIGHAWVSDYGSSDSPEGFRYLHAYSPYHNLRDGVAYPATLVTTADHDDRVVPGHSFKFAARLQEAHAGPAPVLIRIETRAGHGGGTPTSKVLDQLSDKWAFLVENLGITLPEPF